MSPFKQGFVLLLFFGWLLFVPPVLLVLTGDKFGPPTLSERTGAICWVVWALVSIGVAFIRLAGEEIEKPPS